MQRERLAAITGILYAINFVLGIGSMIEASRGAAATADWLNLAGALEYGFVVILLGLFFDNVSRRLSWLVGAVGLAGCITGAAGALHLFGSTQAALVVFGVYCLGLGAMVVRSPGAPTIVGLFLILSGLGWLTYVDHGVSQAFQPYNTAVGILGELVFTAWLIFHGIRGHQPAPAVQ